MKYTTTIIAIVVVLIMMSKDSSNKESFENFPKNFHLKRDPKCYNVSEESMNRTQSSGM